MENKQCPKCGKELVIRRGQKGEFYGCKGYPNCKHTEPLVQSDPRPSGWSKTAEIFGKETDHQNKVNVATEMLISLQAIERGVKTIVEHLDTTATENFKKQL